MGCSNYDEEILLLMDFESAIVTLKNTPLPVTLLNFCIFSPGEALPSSINHHEDLQKWLEHRYEYIE